jgi:hypothetical protein
MKKSTTLHGDTRTRWGSLSWFTKPMKDFRLRRTAVPNSKAAQSNNTYTRCTELPLYNFIRCIVDSDYTYLSRDGIPPPEAETLFEKILLEYIDLTGDEDYSYFIKLTFQVSTLQTKITAIEKALNYLVKNPSQEIEDGLRGLGYTLPSLDDEIAYFKALERVKNKTKGMYIDLQRRIFDLENVRKSQKNTKISEQYFTSSLIEVSKYMKYHVNPREITVAEYAEVIKRMQNEYRQWQTSKA